MSSNTHRSSTTTTTTTTSPSSLSICGRRWPPKDGELNRAAELPSTVSRPSQDPSTVYPAVPGPYHMFQLGKHALSEGKRKEAMALTRKYHDAQKSLFMGFQCNQQLDFGKRLGCQLDTLLNNLGDPFTTGNFTLNTKFMERAVLDYYAALWNARWPHVATDGDSYWGFALSMGCTEGNLYGMWNARDYLGGKVLLSEPTSVPPNQKVILDGRPRSVTRLVCHQAPLPKDSKKRFAFTPIAFYSEDTHYSFTKAMRILNIRTFYDEGHEKYKLLCPLEGYTGIDWPREVPSKPDGSMDIDALGKLVEFFAALGYPILVSFNYGTTFKGAYDDVESAGQKLVPILKKHALYERKVYYDPENRPHLFDTRNGFWFHVDGALGAAYMPFIEMAYNAKLIDRRGPNFDFRLNFVHSIAMSGHKWIGMPFPSGIYMSKTKFQLLPPSNPEYIGARDTTFAGSRNGLSAMLLWDYLSRSSYAKQILKALYAEAMAQYTESRLRMLGVILEKDLWVSRTPLSLTVHFRKPKSSIVEKYSLSCETLLVNRENRAYAHVFMMEHVNIFMVNALINDLSQPGAFPEQAPPSNAKQGNGVLELELSNAKEGRGFHGW